MVQACRFFSSAVNRHLNSTHFKFKIELSNYEICDNYHVFKLNKSTGSAKLLHGVQVTHIFSSVSLMFDIELVSKFMKS